MNPSSQNTSVNKVAVYHPTGNRNVNAVISALHRYQMLHSFSTTIAFNPSAPIANVLPASLKSELMRRAFEVPVHLIHQHQWREIARLLLPKIGLKSAVAHESKFASIDAVYNDFDRISAKRLLRMKSHQLPQAVYAYEDGALDLFRTAKERGIKCIYDLPIAYWKTARSLLKQQAEFLPEWAQTLGGGISDSAEKLERKTEELKLADVVVGPGKFVMDSLPLWSSDKPRIVSPFGSPVQTDETFKTHRKDKPLRVLFVGSMGQRKGLGDLFKAFTLLNRNDVELVVLGSLQAPMSFYRNQFSGFIYEKGRPHPEVLALMESCDVFCLPSIVEGRALVMQEAMSRSLPIIITANTGGEDLVIEGETGFLVPINAPEIIAQRIELLASDRNRALQMGESAAKHASSYTWQKYGDNIAAMLSDYLMTRHV